MQTSDSASDVAFSFLSWLVVVELAAPKEDDDVAAFGGVSVVGADALLLLLLLSTLDAASTISAFTIVTSVVNTNRSMEKSTLSASNNKTAMCDSVESLLLLLLLTLVETVAFLGALGFEPAFFLLAAAAVACRC